MDTNSPRPRFPSYQVLSLRKGPNPLDAEEGGDTDTPRIAEADES